MPNKSLNALGEAMVEKLNEVKEIMNKQKDELMVSIRRDVVATELKDILESHSSFYSLKNALEEYIKDLYKIDREIGADDESK